MAEPGDDWSDEAVWHAVNPGLAHGYPDRAAFRDKAAKAAHFPFERDSFQQFNLNRWLRFCAGTSPTSKSRPKRPATECSTRAAPATGANVAGELAEAILEVAQALHAMGETEAAAELRDLWQEMREVVAEFEAGRIGADELRDGLLRMRRQATEAAREIRAIDDVRLQGAVAEVDRLTGALNDSTNAGRPCGAGPGSA